MSTDPLKDVKKGTWEEAGGHAFRPQIVDHQVGLLLKLRGLLEGEVGRLEGKLAEAKEAHARMKHGGGA